MKRRSLLPMILSLVMCLGIAVPAWAAENVADSNDNQVRLIDVEKDLLAYIEIYQPDIVFGSTEFIEYAVDVLMSDVDNDLAALDNYNDIRYYLGEYLYQLNQAESQGEIPESGFVFPTEYKLRTLDSLKSEVESMSKAEEAAYAMRTIAVPYYRYNASAAAAYAIKYGERLSENYPRHDSDCTNFVSQAVHAGGINMNIPSSHSNGITKTTDYWYCLAPSIPVNPWHESSSWVNVDDFYSYAVYTVGASRINCPSLSDLQNSARVGDVVQLCNNSGNWYHSIIISSGTKGNWKYCGHTSDRSDYPLSAITGAVRFRIIRF